MRKGALVFEPEILTALLLIKAKPVILEVVLEVCASSMCPSTVAPLPSSVIPFVLGIVTPLFHETDCPAGVQRTVSPFAALVIAADTAASVHAHGNVSAFPGLTARKDNKASACVESVSSTGPF